MEKNLFRGVGIEIELPDSESFLKVKETLTRIGIASRKEKKLHQSCHILHKQGKYAILHFKELFILDGKENNITEEDYGRRNTIVNLLEEWNLIKVVDQSKTQDPITPLSQIKIISYKEKNDWELSSKYQIGVKK
jgi:hypothetical protein